MGRPINNLAGKIFGRLTVTSLSHITKKGRACWNVLCSCGNVKKVLSNNLTQGTTKSCGCSHIKHGHSRRKNSGETSTYTTWRGMLDRCYNETHERYHRYGGRDIKICLRWKDFSLFLEDVGKRPAGMSIDRIENNKNYSCGRCSECKKNNWKFNVRWATSSQQRLNQEKR